MSGQQFKAMDVLRLEVERPPASSELVNLVQNPRGELGAWGWLTPLAGSVMTVNDFGPGTAPNSEDTRLSLRYRNATTGDVPSYFTSEDLPVTAGKYVTARLRRASSSASHAFRLRWEFYNAAGALISSGPQTALIPTTSLAEPANLPSAQVPAGGVRARLRVDFYRDTGANPQSNRFMAFNWAVAVQTSAAIDPTIVSIYTPPAYYTNVLGPTLQIGVDRAELNVSTLTAEIADAALDPAQGELIRPGRRVRLLARRGGTGDLWDPVFTGKVSNGRTVYDQSRSDAKRARITLTAIDATSRAAQVPAPQGVASIDELPYILEGAGVPWNVNGSGNQVRTTPAIVSVNESAKVIDQVAITRDSRLGYAWVDQAGVLQVWDRATIDQTVTAFLTEGIYSDLDVDFDTDRLINTVNVKLLRPNLATGETVEVTYGPYVSQDSIDKWGPHVAEFTVHGIADTEAAASAYAAQILAANATPTVRINSVKMPIALPAHIAADRALIDLYDRVRVRARPLPLAGNIVPNGSREPDQPDPPTEIYIGLAEAVFDTAVKHSGTRSTRLDSGGADYRGLIYWSGSDYAFDVYPATQKWIGSAWVKGPAGRILTIGFRWRSASSGYLGEGQGMRAFYLDGTWQRIYTDPVIWAAGGEDVQPGLQIRTDPSGWQAGEKFWIDDVQIEPGDTLTPFAPRTWTPVLTDARVVGVKHTILPAKWLTELSFGAVGTVAPPQATPSAPGGAVSADASASANPGDVVLLQEGLTSMGANGWIHTSGMTPYRPAKGDSLSANGGVITILKTGWYEVGAQCYFGAAGNARYIMRLIVGTNPDQNIIVMTEATGYGGALPALNGSMVIPLNAGDTLRQYLFCTGATSTDWKKLYARALGPL